MAWDSTCIEPALLPSAEELDLCISLIDDIIQK